MIVQDRDWSCYRRTRTHFKIAVLCATAECRVTGKKRKKNKESTAVKLKALTSGCLIRAVALLRVVNGNVQYNIIVKV